MSTVNPSAFRLTPEALRYLRRNAPPDPARLADALFTRLDTERQGYLRKTDLEKALAVVPTDGDSAEATSAEALFSHLDSNGDGRLTRDEFAWSVSRLADQLYQRLKIMNAPRDDGASIDPSAASVARDAGVTVVNAEWRQVDGVVDGADLAADYTMLEDEAVTAATAPNAARAGPADWDTGGDFAVLRQIMQLARAYGVNDGSNGERAAARFAARV